MRPVVLLVDDDPMLLAGLRRALRGEPFDVRVAAGAYEALSLIKAWGGVDAIITDQHMPGMPGTTLLATVRERYPDTARFILTGRPALDVALEAINSGAIHRFFVKPCNPQEVAGVVRAALRDRMIAAAGRVSSGPMLLVDLNAGRITHVNPAAAALLGVDAAALCGRALAELIGGDGVDAAGDAQAFLAQPPPAIRRWRMRRPDGTLQDVEVSSHALAEGDATACLGLRNVGELSQLEAEVTQLQRSEIVGQLVGGVAHDLRNLLMVINGRSELIAGREDDTAAVKRAVEAIQATAIRGTTLTRHLMDYLRRGDSAPGAVDVNAVLTAAADLLAKIVGSRVELVVDLAPDAAIVQGDGVQIEQVVMNLALNARDAMPQGGTLGLRTLCVEDPPGDGAPPGLYVAIEVSDTGIGMPADVRRKAFEPFFTTKEAGQGTGLGLPTVARIVRAHGGHLALQSEPGSGTTFTVYLPRADDAAISCADSARS